jgi:hypothetical protein
MHLGIVLARYPDGKGDVLLANHTRRYGVVLARTDPPLAFGDPVVLAEIDGHHVVIAALERTTLTANLATLPEVMR